MQLNKYKYSYIKQTILLNIDYSLAHSYQNFSDTNYSNIKYLFAHS